ncbi:MAG TPA: glutaredoxin family protein [Dokdonella sp.]|uniref:glutaredoxin family protein n=1 Tax=Dokdonella sp. TaxID=2291710 RepID=UPI0025B918C5|nr:glutaredoxin family protein [Dokdonella sp.]MBX3690925.1 glutaredoxin family protein [Dokdonella sp.]MCW5568299.1 glutaredoxin family protein [Dokdonella sp.]HNR91985.1 glutaredoxin family protein [Dokdonella sp.]
MFQRRSILAGFGLTLFSIVASTAMAAPSKSKAPPPGIIMYTTQTCSYCVKARNYLKARNLAWDERDIERSEAARKEWAALGGKGTPVIVIDGKALMGFSQAGVAAELARHGL